jgi:uncharacterized protein YcaQ
VATRADLIDFTRVKGPHVALLDDALLSGAAGLVPVRVSGWPMTRSGSRRSGAAARAGNAGSALGVGSAAGDAVVPNAWADPAALESAPRGRHRTAPLSPFDSLIWDRARTERVFGVTHRLEAYVPKEKRIHGYFAMPVLAGGRLIGRFDPAREGTTLVARQVGFGTGGEPGGVHPRSVRAMADALWEAASWVGCDDVRVERVDPPGMEAPLRTELTK